MFELAQNIINTKGFVSVPVHKTYVSLKKVQDLEVSLQLEFNYSSMGFYSPDYAKLNSAEAWRTWRGSVDYRSIFCKIVYDGKVPVVDNVKLLTATGGLALGELVINKEDCRKAACYKCGPHPDFIIVAKGRKAERLEIDPTKNLNFLF
jgi:hypothetical protein